jgi:hypothetical protein
MNYELDHGTNGKDGKHRKNSTVGLTLRCKGTKTQRGFTIDNEQ